MKGLQALQADRKELAKKFAQINAERDAIVEEVQKIDNAIAALGATAGDRAVAKPVARKKKIKNPKNASNQKKRHAAIRAILKRAGNDKLTYAQADAIRKKEAAEGKK